MLFIFSRERFLDARGWEAELDNLKAEAARSEQEGDGASDIEALFASAEDAKPPTVLAAETRRRDPPRSLFSKLHIT